MVVLFLDKAHDPGVETLGPLAYDANRWLIRGVLADLLANAQNASSLLSVLRPLVAASVEEVQREGPQWVQSIQQMPQLATHQRSLLVDLLVKFVMQRFVDLPYKELERMLKLTPLEQTRAGQELMELGKVEGRVEGRMEGRVEGLHDAIRIVLATRFPDTSSEMMTRLAALLSYLQDFETVEMLLQLAAQIDSFAAFEQKVVETFAKSTLPKASDM